MIIPRWYQERAISFAEKYLKSENKAKKPGIIVSPTGTGKSILITMLVNLMPDKKILVLQPSKELLTQNYYKYTLSGNFAAIYSASVGLKMVDRVTFATLGSVINESRLKDVDCIIIDECDIYPSDGMLSKFIENNTKTLMIGLTATPWRMHYSRFEGARPVMLNRSKKSPFGQFIYIVQIEDIYKDYWATLTYESYEFNRGKLKLKSTGLDYTEESMRAAIEPVYPRVAEYIDDLDRKRILTFMPDIASANKFVSLIKKKKAFAVSSKTPAKERDYLLDQYKKGFYDVAVNVNILSVGFDYPEIDAIIGIRPTNSLRVHYQQYGRGSRPSENKTDCLIADFVGNVPYLGKIEDINFKYVENSGWNLFIKNKRLTGESNRISDENKIAANPEFQNLNFDFGKYAGRSITDVARLDLPYLKWVAREFKGKKLLVYNIKSFLYDKGIRV